MIFIRWIVGGVRDNKSNKIYQKKNKSPVNFGTQIRIEIDDQYKDSRFGIFNILQGYELEKTSRSVPIQHLRFKKILVVQNLCFCA